MFGIDGVFGVLGVDGVFGGVGFDGGVGLDGGGFVEVAVEQSADGSNSLLLSVLSLFWIGFSSFALSWWTS